MKREEALRIIKECKEKGFKHTFYTLNEYHTALDIAIKALEQEPCEDWYDVPSNEMTVEQARQAVKDLRKKLAEHLEQEPCEDAISRQAVLNLINADWKYEGLEEDVSSLPPVTPQPKTGHWEHGRELSQVFISGVLKGINYEDWHCSNCHCVVEQSIKPKWSYCPNCGAKMQEVDNGDK